MTDQDAHRVPRAGLESPKPTMHFDPKPVDTEEALVEAAASNAGAAYRFVLTTGNSPRPGGSVAVVQGPGGNQFRFR